MNLEQLREYVQRADRETAAHRDRLFEVVTYVEQEVGRPADHVALDRFGFADAPSILVRFNAPDGGAWNSVIGTLQLAQRDDTWWPRNLWEIVHPFKSYRIGTMQALVQAIRSLT